MICPFCQQAMVLKAYVKTQKKIVQICPECDTVWTDEVSSKSGMGLKAFMGAQELRNPWSEIIICPRLCVNDCNVEDERHLEEGGGEK